MSIPGCQQTIGIRVSFFIMFLNLQRMPVNL